MMLPPGLWGDMAGMEHEKQIIERRIVDPLAHPDVAERYGVKPPKAVILFGPPGTGKTSFAKAVSSRLGWPFVELFPSRLAAIGTGGLAASLREAFAELAELDELVLFIDEVEEIATARSGASTAELGVTNELLKLIPAFRQHDSRLLVCATNAVHSLDSAFLRPGRFDYVIPIGPPDQPARSAVCSTARPSVALIAAPANIASRLASNPHSRARSSSNLRVSRSQRFLDRSAKSSGACSVKASKRPASRAKASRKSRSRPWAW